MFHFYKTRSKLQKLSLIMLFPALVLSNYEKDLFVSTLAGCLMIVGFVFIQAAEILARYRRWPAPSPKQHGQGLIYEILGIIMMLSGTFYVLS